MILVTGVVSSRFELPKLILTFGGILAAAMMLTGAVPWQYSRSPGLFLSVLVAAWSVILTLLALLAARLVQIPNVIAATALTVAAFTLTRRWAHHAAWLDDQLARSSACAGTASGM